MIVAIAAALIVMALGGAAYAFVGESGGPSQKRVSSVAKAPTASGKGGRTPETGAQRRKNVQQLLKDIEAKNAEKKEKITLRRRLEMAGRLVRLGPNLAFAATTYRELEALALAMADPGPLTPAAFRDATGTSRRYVLAVLEDLDRRGLLVRTAEGHRRAGGPHG